MLGHGGKGNVVRRGKLAHRTFALREPRQDTPARRVRERPERGVEHAGYILNHTV
jgi:hypothetical protein